MKFVDFLAAGVMAVGAAFFVTAVAAMWLHP
jgi:hypothetical protein